jgi:predicted ferric reductase
VTGRVLVFFLLFLAFLFSIPAASYTGLATWGSLAASSTAYVAMGINQVLATRPRWVEGAFGGLDRIYHFHRQIGMLILVLILIHWYVTPDFQGKQLTGPLNVAARTIGKYTFYGFIALLALSLIKRIPFTKINIGLPYQWWRLSHRLMGVFFVAISFHQLFIKRPFEDTVLLANYLKIWAAVGTLAFLWTQFGFLFKRRRYEVVNVERLPGATVIEARPVGRPIRARPGQFGFLKFKKFGLTEPHPFTIAGLMPDGGVRFAIKPLGDFTARLKEMAAKGDRIRVEGGYGRFTHTRGGKKQLWLAGGIGITPFLAMADSLTKDEKRQIHLVHCVRDASEAVRDQPLAAKAAEVAQFGFTLFDSTVSGRIDAEKLKGLVPFDLNGAELWFCGPPPLREAIAKGLSKAGVRLLRVEYERFEFR